MTLKRFNVKAGLSVGANTAIDVIDANGNATFGTVTANSITTTASNISLPNANVTGTLDVSGNATFYGNLTVEGNITLIGSTDVAITDKNITLAYGANTAAEANGGGITIAGANANITYLSATDSFDFNKQIVGNLTGTASNANVANTVSANAQPNITSVGTLANLTVSGNIFSPVIVQNASFYDTRIELGSATGIIAVTTNGNTTQFLPSGQINLGGASKIAGGPFGGSELELATSQTNLKQLRDGSVTVQVGTGGTATSTWSFANTGNLTLPSNTAAINYANGTSITALVANATYATTAGTADSVAGANVTGTVANAEHANTASAATVAYNINGGLTNSLVVQNGPGATGFITISNPGTILTVSSGNLPLWTEPANVSVGNANIANTAGTVTTNAQPNITSVGTLSSLAVSGSATITGNLTVSGNVTYANVNTVIVEDPVIQLGGGANGNALTSNDGRDRGTYLHVFDTSANAEVDKFMGWDNSNSEFGFGSNVTMVDDVVTFNAYGNIRAGYFIGNGSSLSSITGANVTGTVANATSATTSETVTTAAQPNITSTGTLTSLTVSGTSNLGDVGNVTITGGSNGQVLTTNGSNVLSWTTVGVSNLANGTSNVSISAANGNVNTSVGGTANVLVVTATGANVAGTLNATGNVTLGAASTDVVRVNGYMGVGAVVTSTTGLVVSSSALTGATQQGVYSAITGTSTATTAVNAFTALPRTAAAAYTAASVVGYLAADAGKGAGSTITNQYGISVADQTQGTNNYGIRSSVSSGASKWNIYADGTANNYFAGNVSVGTPTPTQKLEVVGTAVLARSTNTPATSVSSRYFGGAYSGNPLTLINAFSPNATTNQIIIGGSTSLGEPATVIGFYTGTPGANATGSQVASITSTGLAVTGNITSTGSYSAPTLVGNTTVQVGTSALNSTYMSLWSAANTDITALISGSQFGSLIEGYANGHLTLGIRSNDLEDGFQIIGKQANNATYTLKMFSVNNAGNGMISGDFAVGGNLTANNATASKVIGSANANSNISFTSTAINLSANGTANVVAVSSTGITVDGAVNYDEVGTTPQMWFQGKLTSDVTLTNNADVNILWNAVSNPRSWTWNSGGNGRLVPGKLGWYRVTLKCNYKDSGSSATTQINTQIRLNGVSQSIAMATNNQYNMQTVVNTAYVYLSSVTDYFEFTAYTNVAGQILEGGTPGSSVLVEWASN